MKKLIVPNEDLIKETLLNKAQEIAETFEVYYQDNGNLINDIEYKYSDGFIPFTNGGFQVSIPISFDYPKNTGNGFSSKDIQHIYDNYQETCYKDILEELKCKDWEGVKDNGKEQEFYDLESEWNNEDFFYLDIHVHYYDVENSYNQIGTDSCYIYYGVNFDSYGRSKYCNIINKKDIDINKTSDIIEFIENIQF